MIMEHAQLAADVDCVVGGRGILPEPVTESEFVTLVDCLLIFSYSAFPH